VEQQPQPSAGVEQPDPAELQRLIAELDQLPNREFARAFRDYVVDQSSLEQAAYRSYQLAEKSLAAGKKIMNDVNADLRRREKQDPDWAASARSFRKPRGPRSRADPLDRGRTPPAGRAPGQLAEPALASSDRAHQATPR
jgi:hypothetical protein